MSQFLTVKLNTSHNREAFTCGKGSLDNYLKKQASQDGKRGLAVVYIYPDDAEPSVIRGYYSLSNLSIPKDFAPKEIQEKMPRAYHTLPCTLLGRLAIATEFKRKGLGEILLIDALLRSVEAASILGSIAVIVDPLDNEARAFYKKFHFIELTYENKMFLPMNTIKQIFEK